MRPNGEPRVGLDRRGAEGGPPTQVPREEAVDRRDAEELAEALEPFNLFSSRILSDEDFLKAMDALARFRSKYPKEDTDG